MKSVKAVNTFKAVKTVKLGKAVKIMVANEVKAVRPSRLLSPVSQSRQSRQFFKQSQASQFSLGY